MSRLQCLNLKLLVFKHTFILARKNTISTYLYFGICRYSKLINWGTKKSNTNVKIIFYPEGMADPQIEQILAPLRAAVKKQVSDSLKKINVYF